MRRFARSIAGATLLLVGGCGFHLQGSDTMPRSLASVNLVALDTQSDFFHGLRAALLSSGTVSYTHLTLPTKRIV